MLIFAAPESPLSQPAQLIGGHLLATALALTAAPLMPDTWWSVSLLVGGAMAAMVALRLTHPPAGADPILVFLEQPDPWFLIMPVGLGALLLVVAGVLYHRLPPRHLYPLPVPPDPPSSGPA